MLCAYLVHRPREARLFDSPEAAARWIGRNAQADEMITYTLHQRNSDGQFIIEVGHYTGERAFVGPYDPATLRYFPAHHNRFL